MSEPARAGAGCEPRAGRERHGAPGAPELLATYRLQLTSSFGFADARALIPYLRDLGVSHLYLSPSFQARPGSAHGYDVIDPGQPSSDLGGADELRRLTGTAHAAGMGLILDIVPNHMAADEANRYWADPGLREQFFDVDPVTGRHRRFFDIDDLAGMRQEDPDVFEATHALALSLVREGLVDGLRIDHPDGLADPAGYLQLLSQKMERISHQGERLSQPGERLGVPRVWVEKILGPGERLRDWPVCGTVGYELLNEVCALFVDPAGEAELTSLWEAVSGDARSFAEVAFEAKLEQATTTFRPELERLLRELSANFGSAVKDTLTPEPKFGERLARALASLPIYRTYIDPAARTVSEADAAALAHVDPDIRSLLLDGPAAFVTRFQQTTPAIMAKGVEDTAFYRYGRLLALNEVGGDPGRFGLSVDAFHARCAERGQRFPESLVTTMTHDAKRSADVRARIGVLASMTGLWGDVVERFFKVTEQLREDGAPDDVERYYLLQTLVGAWPIEPGRIQEHMVKALREAKRNTSWVRPNHEWEQAVVRFCARLYGDQRFLAAFEPFAAQVAVAGERAALGQLVLKLTVPGVSDIYRGDELPYRALVDPDNRRPVDFDWRQAMLRRLMGGAPVVDENRKLFVILRLLGLRARRPEPFAGVYEPLDAGPDACAFVRGGDVLVVVAVRERGSEAVLADAPRGSWRNVFTGEELTLSGREPLARLLDEHGLGVLERCGMSSIC